MGILSQVLRLTVHDSMNDNHIFFRDGLLQWFCASLCEVEYQYKHRGYYKNTHTRVKAHKPEFPSEDIHVCYLVTIMLCFGLNEKYL